MNNCGKDQRSVAAGMLLRPGRFCFRKLATNFCRLGSLLLHCILLTVAGNAQSDHSIFVKAEQFSTQNGLPGNTIHSMCADENGYVWISTSQALIRFDGYRFKVMLEGGVYLLGYYQRRLLAIHQQSPLQYEIWADQTLHKRTGYRLFPTGIQQQLVRQVPGKVSGDQKARPFFTFDESGRSGYYLSDQKQVIYFDSSGSRPTGLFSRSEQDIFLLPSGIYTMDTGAVLSGSDKGRMIRSLKGSLPLLLAAMDPAKRAAGFFSQTGKQVFFCTGSSIYLVSEPVAGVLNAVLLTDQADIASMTLFLYLPVNASLIVGSFEEGFRVFRREYFKPLIYNFKPEKGSAAPEELVALNKGIGAVQVYQDSLLLSKYGLLHPNGNTSKPPVEINSDNSIPKTGNGYFLSTSPETDQFVNVWNDSGRLLAQFEGEKTGLAGYFNDKDTTYLGFRNGAIWKLYLGADGTCKKLWRIVLPHYSHSSRFFLEPLSRDSVFAAGRDKIHILHTRTHQYRVMQLRPGYFEITTTYADQKGTVWIGTKGNGWYKYNSVQGLVELPADKAMHLQRVAAITEDANGYMWVAAFRGLFRFLKKDLDAVQNPGEPVFYNYYSAQHGLIDYVFEPNRIPGIPVFPDGTLVFPSVTGKLLAEPGRVPVSELRVPINIDQVSVDDVQADIREHLELPPSFNSIRFEISVPYFGNPNDLQLEYNLTGRWMKVNPDGIISFNRLQHGTYTLLIRMPSAYGKKEYIVKSISFTVNPFWYQSWWFYVLLVLLFLLLSAFFFRLWGRKIKRQNELLESQVAIRSARLIASEETIRQHTQFKSRVTSLVLHDVRSPLFYLNKITSSIYKTSEGRVEEPFREQLKELHLQVRQVAEYAQNLFAWVNTQQEDFVSVRRQVVLKDLLEEICTNYQLLSARRHNRISCQADPLLKVVTEGDLLQIILRNLTDNAIRYTSNGEIMLSASERNGEVMITVSDNGKGMNEQKVQSLLNDDGQLQQVSRRSGIGYRYIRDLLQKMNGRMQISSQVDKGTVVTIILPG